jgi:hypothetical protein
VLMIAVGGDMVVSSGCHKSGLWEMVRFVAKEEMKV